MAVDYDAPRSTPASDDGELEIFPSRRGTDRSDTGDVDETTGSPGIDTVDDELTGPVIAMRTDEFRCQRCFLITHRHQLVDRNGTQICRECA